MALARQVKVERSALTCGARVIRIIFPMAM
jgi:hypothetical protein